MFRRSWKTQMTPSERQRGWVFLILYLLVFPRLNTWAQRVLTGDGEALVAETNVVYYALLFALALLVFWSFLKKDFVELLDWLPENLFGVLAGLLGAGALHLLVGCIAFPVQDPIPPQYAAQLGVSPVPTVVLVVVLIPVVEEVVYRGILFGSLREYSRPAAMVVCVLFYALAGVWRYALEYGDLRYLLLTVLYLPKALALTWCYDNGGSIWASAVLHGGINAAILFTA